MEITEEMKRLILINELVTNPFFESIEEMTLKELLEKKIQVAKDIQNNKVDYIG